MNSQLQIVKTARKLEFKVMSILDGVVMAQTSNEQEAKLEMIRLQSQRAYDTVTEMIESYKQAESVDPAFKGNIARMIDGMILALNGEVIKEPYGAIVGQNKQIVTRDENKAFICNCGDYLNRMILDTAANKRCKHGWAAFWASVLS